jgi:hypothetical protein
MNLNRRGFARSLTGILGGFAAGSSPADAAQTPTPAPPARG